METVYNFTFTLEWFVVLAVMVCFLIGVGVVVNWLVDTLFKLKEKSIKKQYEKYVAEYNRYVVYKKHDVYIIRDTAVVDGWTSECDNEYQAMNIANRKYNEHERTLAEEIRL